MAWSTSVEHHPNSILIVWLLTALALVIERLYESATCTVASMACAPWTCSPLSG